MESAVRRITRADALSQGFTDRQLAQLVRTGTLHRIRPGEFALADEWESTNRLERHRELVIRTAERVSSPQVYSHHAAAALWGIRVHRDWPNRVDVIVERADGGRSSGRLRRHAIGTDGRDIVELDGLLVTSPAQTVVDLARRLSFVDGVVVADSALGSAFGRRVLTTPDELTTRLAHADRGRGARRAHAVVAAADGRSESPPETISRIGTTVLGFPRPEIQREFTTSSGIRRVDQWWPEYAHAGECDGFAKYTDPAFLRGRDPATVFRMEKQRDRELLALPEIERVTHWEPADLYPPSRFYDLLRAADLPSRLPRPRFTDWSAADAAFLARPRATRHPLA